MKKITLLMMALIMTFGAMAQFTMGHTIVQNNDVRTVFKYDGVIKAPIFVNDTKTASVVVSDITTEGENVTFTTTPNADCARYILIVAETGGVEAFASQSGKTVEEVITENGDEYSGVETSTYVGLEPNGVAYTIYIVAIGNDQTTSVSTTNFTSAMTGGTGTANVDITVTDVTQTTVNVSFSINDQTSYYYYIIAELAVLQDNGINTTDDIRGYLEQDDAKATESLAGTVGGNSPLTNNTEYIVCAFPYNQNNVLGTYTAPIHFITGQGVIAGLNDVENVSLSVYPNPAKDNVNIIAKANIEKVEVYNMMGQKVSDNIVNSMITNVNVSNLNVGTYVVKVYTEAGLATKKIVVR
ncbi:MAG: T9SS type A sorting domain-containing protein [Bacteroidales bacterium]